MGAGKFKAQCLAVMDEVQATREPVVVTKNGKPVAKLVPLDLPEEQDPLDAFRFPGLKIVGDLESPQHTDAEWNEFLEREARRITGDEE